LECSFCGREVKSTIHKRDKNGPFLVDYYNLLTGSLEKVAIQNPRDETEMLEFHKLTQPKFIKACVDCFKDDKIKKQMDEMFSGIPK
jgi:hypothetical protein